MAAGKTGYLQGETRCAVAGIARRSDASAAIGQQCEAALAHQIICNDAATLTP
jgi:hypothetical protein